MKMGKIGLTALVAAYLVIGAIMPDSGQKEGDVQITLYEGPKQVNTAMPEEPLRITVLANSIDRMQSKDVLESFAGLGVSVNIVSADEFEGVKTSEIIYILGGPAAPEGVGEITGFILNDYERDRLRESEDSRRVYLKPDVYRPGQTVAVFAGYGKEQTAMIMREAKTGILRQLRFNDDDYDGNPRVVAVTVPPIEEGMPYTDVNPDQAAQVIRDIEGVVIIDVRAPAIYDAGRIPGAVNIPEHKIESSLSELEKDRTYILYCGGNAQSITAGEIMSANGYNSIYRLVDGYLAWRKDGYPRERG